MRNGKTCWYWVAKWPWAVKMGFDDASSCLVMQTEACANACLFTAKNGQAKWKTCCPPLKSSFVNWNVLFIVTLLLFLMGSSEAYEVQWRLPSVSRAMAKDIRHHPNSYVNQKQELGENSENTFVLVTDCSCTDRTYETAIWCKVISSSLKKK